MASEKLFGDIPPFPDNVPTASMHTVSLADLRRKDEDAAKSVFAACQELGFFLLDLHGDELGEAIMDEIDQLFHLADDIMNLPEDVKAQYLFDFPRSFLGFKPLGLVKTETNEPDRFEFFNLGQDGVLGNATLQPLPSHVRTHLPLFTSFVKHGQCIVTTIGETLAAQMALPRDTFANLQKPTRPSGTVVRIIKAFASPAAEDLRTSMMHHTDFGTVTLLANVLGGLQVLAPGMAPSDEDAWLWVRPQPGCLIVNLGDAMCQWSGGLLRSNVHRISYAPGEQRFVHRYSLALLVRPERDASMRRLATKGRDDEDDEDSGLTAWEWEIKKSMALKKGNAVMRSEEGKPTV